MSDERRVDAVLEIFVPLDGVTVHSPRMEKQAAVAEVAEHIADCLGDMDFSICGRYRDERA